MVPLATLPDLMVLWHPTRNIGVTPETVSVGSNKKVWWQCEQNHEWEAQPNALKRTAQCPICAGKRILPGFNDLATTHPDVAEEWHPVKNDDLLPRSFTYGSKQKVWWLGKDCGHEWEATIGSRITSQQKCAVCRGLQVQPGVNDLATTHPRLVEEWHPTKNISLTPQTITAGSNKKVWWLGECGHEWEISPNHRAKGNSCYQCLGRKKAVRQKLLSTHEVFKEIHPTLNHNIKVEQLLLRSNQEIWWVHPSCNHVWKAKVSSRTLGQGCAVCHGSQVQTGVNDLATTHPHLVSQWSPLKNSKKPTEVTTRSHYFAWWVCEQGHEWRTKVQTRTAGHGCPSCDAKNYVSKTEKELADYVSGLGLSTQTSVRNMIRGELDIYVPEKHIAVEFNGLYWHSEAAGKEKNYHYNKWLACKNQGIQLIQVWEDDWARNPDLIKRMLAHKLGVNNTSKIYARDTYLGSVEVSSAEIFLETNHLQGYRAAKYFGLFSTSALSPDSLIALLGVQQKGKKGLEVIRFATNVPVPGGFSKLLKYVVAQDMYSHVTEVFSYSHNDHSDGGMYEKNGFELVHTGAPGYSYWKPRWLGRQNRLKYSPSRMKRNPDMEYAEGATERELAALNNLTRVWDSGSSLWVKKF